MRKRLLSMLIMICMIFSMLPANASAVATPYNVWVAGVQVTSANASNITGEGITGRVTFDASSNTLTLNNASITKYHIENNYYVRIRGIYSTQGLNIKLEGTNTVDISTVDTGTVDYSHAISISNGAFALSGSGSLTVKSGTAVWSSNGINAGNTTITGCSVEVHGGKNTGSASNVISTGILCSRLDIQSATLTAMGGTSSGHSYGIYSMLFINNSTVTASGNTRALESYVWANFATAIGSAFVNGTNPVPYINGYNNSYRWVQLTHVPSYPVTITVKKDGLAWSNHSRPFKLVQGSTSYTDLTAIRNGVYDLYDGTADTGVDVTVNDTAASATVDYYTVSLTKGVGIASTSGAGTYVKGSSIIISAEVTSGYLWSKWTQTTGGEELSAMNSYTITNIQSAQRYTATAVNPDIAVVEAAKAAAEGASYANMTQTAATNETVIKEALKASAKGAVGNDAITVIINKINYPAPIAGTGANPGGTNGSYVFTITVSKGGQSRTTAQKSITITATAYTGITDEQAVAAAKTALVDGSANVAFGADQAAKTAAVQAYVNGILSSTAGAAGVSATVTYNSTTDQYEVTIRKGSTSDSKSLTMTLNETTDPDIATIAAALAAAQNTSYSDMTQATATGETVIVNALKATAETAVGDSSVTITINKVSYIAPIAGTDANPGGTNGSYVFTITVSKGSQSQTTEQKTIIITATAYTGITDEQAVAAAKAALVDGSANVAIGADQTEKTAAVQVYVNGILISTADAAGVSATVTYNSTTNQYEVTITKGSTSDSKSLTMTLNETTDPDFAVVNSARSAVENASYANMTQAAVTSETVITDSLKATAVTVVTGGAVTVTGSAITVTINKISYTEPIAGTSANPSGTDGSYVFTINVSKGLQSQTTVQKTIIITATAYTGVTDVQAVAITKEALVDGSVNVAIGADQATITAAVQAYVNGKLSGTADAVGVTATVTYNSGTGKYDVALSKGSDNDSKSLTMTVIVAPAPSGGSQTTMTKPETKTITVVEVPQSIPNERLLTVEAVGEAFDKSVEVRLKEDTITEGIEQMVMESLSAAVNLENAQIFPMDISIYLKGTDTKVQPKEGTAVMITCPIPTAMITNMDKLVVICLIDGKLQVVPSTQVTKDGVRCVQFTATHFSPYAFVIDYDNILTDYAAGTMSDDVTMISTKLTATAGTLTKVNLEGIKEGSAITYHVSTPTLISIDRNGNLFSKKAGNAILMANVTYGGATTSYTIHITIKNAKGGTKVGFIQYYDDIITYNKINYRITAKATDKAEGTVAVANNQINKNLPKKVVIPATITYQGKTYKVTSIDESAFYNLNKITSITIPAAVKEISPSAFVSCDSLKTFTVSSGNKYYSAKKGMLLNKEGTLLIAYPSAKGTIVIDKKVKVVGVYAFSACKYLTGIVIPKTVTRIEGCGFAHSKSLKKVTFQGTTVPEIPYLSIFEKVNEACTILVSETSLKKYQVAFKNARMPKGARVKGK